MLNGLPIDLNCTKNKSYGRNGNVSNKVDINNREEIGNRVDNEVFSADELPSIDLNRTESESYSDYCDIYNVVDKEIPFMEDIQPNYSNLSYFKNKCHSNYIINTNYNLKNRLGNKKLCLDDFECPK